MLNRLEMIKQSLRIPYTDDDGLLVALDAASMEYVGNAVNSEAIGYQEDDLFVNATLLLTQYWYLNRGEAIADHIPVYVTSMIQQLRGKYA
ncbi:DNA-packaging protein [Enterococcus saigonensis]|uniref:DNA-packaging protein n=2 Tax=Enterococcus TaxID=1350 RepID=A0A679IA81_9ENTE|nr:head-tail connector protein [Enterococcus saigonensis]MCD5030333.1 phage gp6-like head-tail connector protein [Enterococcus asini]BCA84949.1 DNA-packaging protein [Enterococcus saigonensis]